MDKQYISEYEQYALNVSGAVLELIHGKIYKTWLQCVTQVTSRYIKGAQIPGEWPSKFCAVSPILPATQFHFLSPPYIHKFRVISHAHCESVLTHIASQFTHTLRVSSHTHCESVHTHIASQFTHILRVSSHTHNS